MKFIRLFGLTGLIFCFCTSIFGQTSSKPNVLMIVVDDLNDYVGWLNGNPMAESPNLDRLANKGTVFTNAWCNSPSCAPSRTSFMTGKYPEYCGVQNNRSYKDTLVFRDFFDSSVGNETVFTLPEILKDSGGYFTYGFHKIYHGWTSGDYDNDYDEDATEDCDRSLSWNRFFDFRLGVDALPDLDSLNPFNDGVDGLEWGPYENFKEPISNELKVADSVVKFFNEYVTNPAKFCNRPFFASYGALRPHTPYYAPERYFLDYYNPDLYQVPLEVPYNSPSDLWPPNGVVMPPRIGGGLTGLESLGEIANWMATNRNSDEDAIIEFVDLLTPLPVVEPGMDSLTVKQILEETKKAGAVLSYLACIKFVDIQIGKILDALESHPSLASNTIVIMVSDHGYSLGERTHWHKFSLWETDMRIPMIIFDPRKPGGQVVNKPVSLIDLFPTVLELTNIEEPTFPDGSRYLDGQSIVPLLDNSAASWGHPTLGSYLMPLQFPEGTCFTQHTVRGERFHYIQYRTNGAEDDACDLSNSLIEEELYEIGVNREVDPNEWNNLASDPKYQAVKDYLSQWLPGGAFYKTRAPEINIVLDDVPCGLSGSDTIRLSSEIFSADGVLLTSPPSAFNYKWTFQPSGATFNTASVELTPAMLAGIGSNSIDVMLQLINNTGAVSLLDTRTIRLSTEGADAAFGTVLNGNTVSINAVEYPTGAIDSEWDYGDGYVHKGINPVSHSYTMPGTYTISRKVYFDVDGGASCSADTAMTVVIPTSAFDSTVCQTVTSGHAVEVGNSKILFDWNPVFNASSYTIQYRPARETFSSPWQTKNATTSQVLLKFLEEDELYDIRVIATCPTSSSEPGFPVKVLTEPCKPPKNIRINDTSGPGPLLEWDNGEGNVAQVLVKLFEYSTYSSRTKVLPATITSVPAYVLADGDYEVQFLSGCKQYDNSLGKSDPSQPFNFTLGGSARALVNETLELYPNPATSQVSFSITIDQSTFSTNGRLFLTDMKGAVRVDQPILLDGGKNEFNVPVDNLPAGIYKVAVVAGARQWDGKVVVIKGG